MSMLLVSRILATLLTMLTLAILTRYLGAEGFGIYRTITAFLSFAVIAANLGLHLLVAREIAVPGADQARILGQGLGLRLASVTLLLLLAAAASWFLPYSDEVRLGILLGSVGFVLLAANQILLALFQQRLRQKGAVAGELAGASVLFGGSVLLVHMHGDVLAFVLVLVLGHVTLFAVSWQFAQRLLSFKPGMDRGIWRDLGLATLPLAGANVMTLLYYHSDTIILSVLSPPREVGLYGIASKIQDTLVGFSTLFAGLMLPLLTRHAREPSAFRHRLGRGLDTVAFAAIGASAMLIAFAQPAIVLIAGKSFAGAAPALRVLGLTVAVASISLLLRYGVTALGRQRELLPAYLLAVFASIGAQCLLIPHWGAIGAAVGPLVGELVVLLAAWLVLAWRAGVAPAVLGTAKALLAGIGLVLIAWYTPIADLGWLAAAPLMGCLYLVMLTLMGGMPEDARGLLPARWRPGGGKPLEARD